MTYVRVKITRKAGWEADSGASGSIKLAKKRIELMKRYDILD